MAKYSVTHTCGHTQTHGLVGKNADRERKLAWLATTECTECWKKSQAEAKEKQKAQASAEAETFAKEHKLSVIEGTEKQVEWANVIRMQFMMAIEPFYKKMQDNNDAKFANKKDFIIKTWQYLTSITDAKFFIDNRHAEQDANVMDIINFAISGKTRDANSMEIALHVFKLSPYLTLDVAKKFRLEQFYLDRQAKQAAIEANPKPIRPTWYQNLWDISPKEGSGFNGKIYSRNRIYINNKEHTISDEQVTELNNYLAKLSAYRKATGAK